MKKPDNWIEPRQYYQSLPRKRSSAAVLFSNPEGKILFVRQSYNDNLALPGGTVDDNESPKTAAEREVEEELRLKVTDLRLVCVDYVKGGGVRTEGYHFVFDGGILSSETVQQIAIDDKEIKQILFLDPEIGIPKLSLPSSKRLPKCLDAMKNGTTVYLEDGELS